MADSEERRLKRLKEHEQRMSRIFDEVMGLGEFADSSTGSGSSSKSGQDEGKVVEKDQPLGEEDSNCSRREEKMEEEVDEFPSVASFSSEPSFTAGASAGSGGAALDNAMDAPPPCGADDEDDDWDFTFPIKSSQSKEGKSETQSETFAGDSREVEDNEGSSSTTSPLSAAPREDENTREVGDRSSETDDSQQEPPQTASQENIVAPMSPNVNIKEEPIDEGYDAALLPQNSIKHIKEELEHQEEELRISSVFSVGGSCAFAHPSVPPPASLPVPTQAPPQAPAQAPAHAPAPTTFYVPGRGTVLQAMTPLSVRPSAPVLNTLPTATTMPPRPPPPTVPGGVRCSGCSKILMKGQTAFQRKGSTQLFCSTVCLTGHLPVVTKNRTCFQCHKDIANPREMVTMSGDNNTLMNFCGQFCLSVHKSKKRQTLIEPEKRTEPKQNSLPEKPTCSVCKVTGKIEHEVTHQGALHRLCSDACFVTWRKMKRLALNCCDGCGLYCKSNSDSCQTLMVDKSELNFCGPTCISTYKQTCTKTAECACCHKVVVVSSTVMEVDQKGKVQLYCSTFCVEKSRPPKHTLSDTAFPCSHCKASAVPQYHLAMVDGTIRNFCSLDCVTTYRKCSQSNLTNGIANNLPVKDRPVQTASKESISPSKDQSLVKRDNLHSAVVPSVHQKSELSSALEPGATKTDRHTIRLSCHHCKEKFRSKPQLLNHQDGISIFCSNACRFEYKTRKNMLASCGHCKQEKLLYEKISNNDEEVAFCSEGCKRHYKNEHLSNPPCSYCSRFSSKMVQSHYCGQMEGFCKPYCMSKYTVRYYGMARCDSCRTQGSMTENLQLLGSVRNFCNLPCLLQYCYMHFDKGKHLIHNGSSFDPPKLNGTSARNNKNTLIHNHASTQTVGSHVPMPRRRPMKNRSVLCRPISKDQEISCQLLCPPESAAPLEKTESQQGLKSSIDSSTSPPPPGSLQEDSQKCTTLPARLFGRHFLGTKDTTSSCKVCSPHPASCKRKRPEESEAKKRQKFEEDELKEDLVNEEAEEAADSNDKELPGQTTYYCKTCSGKPSLCPVPCFELYHTRLIYREVHELETC